MEVRLVELASEVETHTALSGWPLRHLPIHRIRLQIRDASSKAAFALTKAHAVGIRSLSAWCCESGSILLIPKFIVLHGVFLWKANCLRSVVVLLLPSNWLLFYLRA